MSSASVLVAPGAVVAGKYRLEGIVGEGGMGSVWAATHVGLGQAVAIKFVSKEFVTSTDALRRFDAEAKAAAQLRSRHVVQVFDNGTLEDGTPFIAMELLRGENLHARVHRAGPVALPEAIDILAQCCKALGRAHAAGIVHRDIKPDNIFMAQSQDDDVPLVKVLDFGIAKFAVGPNDHGSTRTGTVLGTPLYMSPEQARGLKTIDHRTDLYSLGLVAYTMLTGNLAFSSESFGDLLLQICTAPLPSLCGNAAWLPPTLEGWFQRTCAREPKDRFGSAQEFIDGLRAASDVAFRPSRLGSDMVSGMQAAPPITGALLQPLAPGAGTASALSRSGDSPNAAVVPKNRVPLIAVAVLVVVGALAAVAAVTFGRSRASAQADLERGATTTAASAALPSSVGAATAPVVAPTITPGAAGLAALDPEAPATASTARLASAAPSASVRGAPPRAGVAGTAIAPVRPPAGANPPPVTTTKSAIDLGY